MTTSPQMVPLDEADFASLKEYATTTLGLEVKPGTNGGQIRGMIKKADDTIAEVPIFIPEGEGAPRAAAPAKSDRETAVKNEVTANDAPVAPAGVASDHADPMHWSHDPKVKIYINKTDDRRRAREVTVSVNGVVFRMQRAKEVDVPYRVYLALENAIEEAAVDSDEVNPFTGDPIKEWEKVHSYPFRVLAMPSADEIAAWEESTRNLVAKAA